MRVLIRGEIEDYVPFFNVYLDKEGNLILCSIRSSLVTPTPITVPVDGSAGPCPFLWLSLSPILLCQYAATSPPP
jgi:hypothetical protein